MNSLWNPGSLPQEILPIAIVGHFIRQGHFELASMLEDEAALMGNEEVKLKFSEMFTIQGKLRIGDITDAISWAQKNSLALEKLGSGLEFQLIRFNFIQILALGNLEKCLEYAKMHFSRFSKKFMNGRI